MTQPETSILPPPTYEGLPFLEAAEAHARRVIGRRPLIDKSPREASLDRFLAKGIPHHKDEEWKYTSLRLMGETLFADDPLGEPRRALFEGIPGLAEGFCITFWNGAFCPSLSTISDVPIGLRYTALDGSTPDRFGEIAKLEGKLGSSNDERFVWLNTAAYADGIFLEIEPGAVIEPPIQIVFLTGGGTPSLSFPRLFIHARENSQAKIIEYHAGQGVYASVSVTETIVEKSAVLEHTRLQDESAEAFHLATLAVEQAENSTYTSNNVQFGSRIGRIDANVWVGGEHGETSLNGAYVGSAEQHLDNHTRIDHAVPNCHSFEVYKGILADRATGVFNGKIFVYPDAQKTDAKQTNQALLLSPTATVDTKPQLEIFADDVKCTHGATVGQLREEALFYLRSRGLPKEEARNMLVYAFVAEVLEKISVESVRDAFEARLFEKLSERKC